MYRKRMDVYLVVELNTCKHVHFSHYISVGQNKTSFDGKMEVIYYPQFWDNYCTDYFAYTLVMLHDARMKKQKRPWWSIRSNFTTKKKKKKCSRVAIGPEISGREKWSCLKPIKMLKCSIYTNLFIINFIVWV